MFWDKEEDQLESFLYYLEEGNIIFEGNKKLCKKILKTFRKPNLLINNSGHNVLPPDYYSDELDIMFDLVRVNDAERKKGCNPMYMADREFERQILNLTGLSTLPEEIKIYHVDKDYGSDEIHTIYNYVKQTERTIREHLSSKGHPNKIKEIWLQEHPTITNKGLLILNEIEGYVQGKKYDYNPATGIGKFVSSNANIYTPWNDIKIVEQIYQSDLDFVIWWMPFMSLNSLIKKINPFFPSIVIADTRYPINSLKTYQYDTFCRC